MSALECPGERRCPRLVVRQAGRGPAGEQQFDHVWQIVACRPRERRRTVLLVPGRDRRARVEQDRRAFDAMRIGPAAGVATAQIMERRRALPIRQIWIHAARQQQTKNWWILQQVRTTAGDHRRHSRTSVQQAHDQVSFAERGGGREYATAAGIRLGGIGGDPAHDFVVFAQPDKIVAVESSTT